MAALAAFACASITAMVTILTISVKGNNVGQAKASLTKFSVIGAGVLIPSNAQGGVYNIIAGSTPAPSPVLIPAALTPTPASLFDISSKPVPAPKQNVIPLIIAVILFILLVFLLWFFITAKKKKEKNVKK